MRNTVAIAMAPLALVSNPALAGDKPLTGPAPDWVTPAPALSLADLPRSGNVVPRFDEQVFADGGTVTAYFDSARLISSTDVLNKSGTLSIPWQPAHGDITFHAVEILRGGETIDALKGGEGITVLRREAGLENLIVDGKLTAVKHIEGLRVGDVLRIAFSVSSRDPVLRGHAQDALLLVPSPVSIGFGRARLIWPHDKPVQWKAMMPGITAVPKAIDGGRDELVLTLPVAKLPEMPKNYPARFMPIALIEFASFRNWAEVASVMAPLYATQGTIAPGSDLAKQADAIAARSQDPVVRMAEALKLVQDQVRYQLLALGNGNYVPQQPADTWNKRFGDCKAKTLLLLALLERLGIKAEPVLANSKSGDAVPNMPAAAMAFDHVFVRAEIGGESFWLDGTMLGSRFEDIRDVPRYGHVLPVRASGADLVKLPVRANARPAVSVDLTYDMSAGPHFPTPYVLKVRYAGTWAESIKVEPGGDYDERLRKFAEAAAKSWTGDDTIGKPQAEYDAALAAWTLTVEGIDYSGWKYADGHYRLALGPGLKVNFDADRSRSTWRTIPGLINQPWTAHSRTRILLPDGGKGVAVTGTEPANLAIPAVEWTRKFSRSGGELLETVVSRESGEEVAAIDISATAKAINEAMGRVANIELPSSYPMRWIDAARARGSAALAKVSAIYDERIAAKPEDAVRMTDRAWLSFRLLDWEDAEAGYGKAIALDPSAKNFVERANVRLSRGDHAGTLADAQAAYDLESGNSDARDLLAAELALSGKVDEALDLLTANPDVTTDDGLEAFQERVRILETGSRHADAMTLLNEALTKHGSNASLRNARCWFKALRNDDLAGALADCNKAIELSSDPATYIDSRAMVHFRAGRMREAKADYEAALAQEPEMASSHYGLALVLDKLGKPGDGASHFDAARRLYPGIDQFYARYGIKP